MNPQCDFKRPRDGPVSSARTKPHPLAPFRSSRRCSVLCPATRHRCRRRRDRVGSASREAPYSLSIIIDLGREILGLLSPVHGHETSLPSLTTPLILNCISARQNCNGTFQCRSINEPHQSPKSVVGRVRTGFAQLGVSRRGCGFVVCGSRSLRGAKKHRTAALFCVSVASHLPARIPIVGLICAMGSAGLRSPEFLFGHFASCAWRLLGGHQKKSEVFSLLRERVRFFLNSVFWNQLLHPRDHQ